MSRTTPSEVAEIIETSDEIKLQPFIDAASRLVDRVETLDTGSLLSAAHLRDIERWLAAHFYAHRDQLFESKSTGRSSGAFQGKTAMALDSTQYGQTAKLLDITGTLASIEQQALIGKKTAGLIWLGENPAANYSE